jgi:hypothetical protein
VSAAIERLNMGVTALVKENNALGGFDLWLYVTKCSDTLCPPGSYDLHLRRVPDDESSDLIQPNPVGTLGCFVTSLAMCLQFAGASTLHSPATVDLDPGALNRFMANRFWTLAQPVGRFDLGEVDPAPTTRYVAANTSLPLRWINRGLRFTRTSADSYGAYSDLDDILCAAKPSPIVLYVKSYSSQQHTLLDHFGHFIVVTGRRTDLDGTAHYDIADPGHADTTFDTYQGDFVLKGYVKDPDDLSELSVGVGERADFIIIDPLGRRTGFDAALQQSYREIPESSYTADAISELDTDSQATGTLHSVQIRSPLEGTYHVSVKGLEDGRFDMSVMTVDQLGGIQQHLVLPGIASAGSNAAFEIHYAPAPGSPSLILAQATLQSTLQDIANGERLHWIDNHGIANSLSQKIEAAGRASGPARRNILNAFTNEVRAQAGKHIGPLIAQVLLRDADSLSSQD